ncbi:hypothetical protein KCU98_g2528, partial [Aureobasidium melanogenum]
MSSLKPGTSVSESNPAPDSATAIPTTCQSCKPAPIFSIKTLQTLLWYIAIGFSATALLDYLGINASPSRGRAVGNPRSICLSRDKNDSCTSWASYTGSGLPGRDENTITDFSIECAQSGGSAEFKTIMSDGGILFICEQQS